MSFKIIRVNMKCYQGCIYDSKNNFDYQILHQKYTFSNKY